MEIPGLKLDPEDQHFQGRCRVGTHGYALRNQTLLHRLLMNPPPGMEVDHINGDRLDNRREWYGTAKTEPLTADWLTKGFETMRQRDEEHRIWQCEQAAEFREAMQNPKFAARQQALTQACLDVGCPFPNPLNPPFISKTMYDRVNARADEILEAK